MSILEMCPYFRGVHSERFHYLNVYLNIKCFIVRPTHSLPPSLPQGQVPMSRKVYSLLLSFCGHSDEEIKIKSLIGFGERVKYVCMCTCA